MQNTSDWFWSEADAEHEASVIIAPKTSKTTKARRVPEIRSWRQSLRTRTRFKPKRESNTQPWLACTKEEAEPYKKYRTLYGERKFARDFSMQKQNLSFSDDLPAEIRLQIFQYLFNTPDNYFELWAPREWVGKVSRAKNLFRQFASQKKVLKMMRLCKKIRQELSEDFYGGNNFRFSHANGFLVMAAFNYTIGATNYNFIKHVTVQIPNRERWDAHGYSVSSKTAWQKFDEKLAHRGMRLPDYRRRIRRGKSSYRAYGEPEYTYDKAVYKGFRQLQSMHSLKRLEITIPWDHKFLDWDYDCQLYRNGAITQCFCPNEDVEAMSPEDRVWHTIEEHCCDPEYWTLLAGLTEHNASKDLTIALVVLYDYSPYKWTPGSIYTDREIFTRLRQVRWIAAYAALMGYEFGYARWEVKGGRGTYKIRYDDDPMSTVVPEGQENSLLEPPELPEYEEETTLLDTAE